MTEQNRHQPDEEDTDSPRAFSPLADAERCADVGNCRTNPTETCDFCEQRVCHLHIWEIPAMPNTIVRLCAGCLSAEGFFDEDGNWIPDAGKRTL